ncbi:uncharacterized protein DUF397 [Halopolyspora algeriensis]|uniref:Uncharacterized protein DUF397 n=1 Tax=Halopolyspora algeriensis TaxID=1500506 RepID=A0A368VNK0_9ACTN|nr:DUF397 domain-containing protein [Halopolyspora algeriensis]RCW40683.1 uncharacterized protein DUF397 [Halopolyspora algeriensis]TQM53394.1 uncharacterized protein DUF397 [Halopolyspora algeriensis]
MSNYRTDWFTSSYSGPNNNSCVEARFTGRGIDIRDSKDRQGGHLSFDADRWADFLRQLDR